MCVNLLEPGMVDGSIKESTEGNTDYESSYYSKNSSYLGEEEPDQLSEDEWIFYRGIASHSSPPVTVYWNGVYSNIPINRFFGVQDGLIIQFVTSDDDDSEIEPTDNSDHESEAESDDSGDAPFARVIDIFRQLNHGRTND